MTSNRLYIHNSYLHIREKCIVFKKIDYKVGYKCP